MVQGTRTLNRSAPNDTVEDATRSGCKELPTAGGCGVPGSAAMVDENEHALTVSTPGMRSTGEVLGSSPGHLHS